MTTTLTEKTFAELFTYAGAGQGTFTNAQGWIQPKPAGAVPRYEYDPLTKASKGLLIEGSRTNVLLVSSRFETASWVKSNVVVTPGAAIAPNGRWDACKLCLTTTGAAGNGRIHQVLAKAATATTYAYSFYVKAAGSSAGWIYVSGASTAHAFSVTFNVATMAINGSVTGEFVEVSKRIIDVGNGWRRVEIVFTSDASAGLIAAAYPGVGAGHNGPGDGAAGLYIWGAQLEVGAFPSSYILNVETFNGRASIGSYYDANGVMRYAAAGVARNSYEPSNLTLTPGFLAEEQRTNILLKSSDMHLSWTGGGLTRTPGKLAPDGTLRAVEFSGTSTTPNTQNVAATATVMTYSIYLKNVSRTANVDLLLRNTTTLTNDIGASVNLHGATPSITGAGWEMRPVGDGWFRCMYTSKIAIAVGDILTCYAVVSGPRADNGACLAWGAQLEAGAYATSYIPSTETFTSRASIGTYFDSTGAMKTAAAGVARMTYNPADLTVVPWLLLEGGSTNLLLNSQITLGVAEGSTPPTVASTTVDGEACVAVTFTSASAVGYAGSRVRGGTGVNAAITSGTAYSMSAYLKLSRPLTGTEAINLYYTGASGMGGFSISAANSIQFVDRFSRTITQNIAPSATGAIYPVVHTSGVLTSNLTVWICKGQIEEGAVATSYIPTTSATVTRAADVSTSAATTRLGDSFTSVATTRAGDGVRVDTSRGWCNAAEGTIFMEFGRPREGDVTTRNLVEIGTAVGNRLGLGFTASGLAYAYSAVNGLSGPNTVSTGLLSTPVGSPVKIALSYGADGLRFACNGQLLKAAMPTVPPFASLGIGNLSYSGGNQPFFHVRAVRYQPQKLTDAEVVALTT